MRDIPIEQMDERRLRVELLAAWAANQLLLVMAQEHTNWGKDQVFHYCTKGIAPYPRVICSVCPPEVPIDGSTDFNVYERLVELQVENARLTEREQVVDALEAAGVEYWAGYEGAMEILRKIQNGTT